MSRSFEPLDPSGFHPTHRLRPYVLVSGVPTTYFCYTCKVPQYAHWEHKPLDRRCEGFMRLWLK